jgi:hypothetical protein
MKLLRMLIANLHFKWRLTSSSRLSFPCYGLACVYLPCRTSVSSSIISPHFEGQVVPSPDGEGCTHATIFIRLGIDGIGGREEEVSVSQGAGTSV